MLKEIDNGYISFGNDEIRIIIDNDDKLWINGKDLAETLDYANTNDAILKHTKEKDRKKLCDINVKNIIGHPHTVYLSEAGMYKLVTKSKMKKAEIFSDWVTEDVLPSIRKYGIYKLKKNMEAEKIELMDKINFMEKEMKKLKNELKKDVYPDGGYTYAINFSTEEEEIYKIGASKNFKKRMSPYNTHNSTKREYVIQEKTDCPVRLEYCIRGMLYKYRYKNKKDTYVCSLNIIKKAFKECIKAVSCMDQTGGGNIISNIINNDTNKLEKLNNKIKKLDKKLGN